MCSDRQEARGNEDRLRSTRVMHTRTYVPRSKPYHATRATVTHAPEDSLNLARGRCATHKVLGQRGVVGDGRGDVP
jgi:hypothetical protein